MQVERSIYIYSLWRFVGANTHTTLRTALLDLRRACSLGRPAQVMHATMHVTTVLADSTSAAAHQLPITSV